MTVDAEGDRGRRMAADLPDLLNRDSGVDETGDKGMAEIMDPDMMDSRFFFETVFDDLRGRVRHRADSGRGCYRRDCGSFELA